MDVRVGLRADSASRPKAEGAGLRVVDTATAAREGDVVMMLVPDEQGAEIYEGDIAPGLRAGNHLAFGHGFNIHYKKIGPPADVNVFMVAPKGPGQLVRSEYEKGRGVPCLLAIAQDPGGDTKPVGLAYAKGIGGTRAAVLETTFKEETETDLFGEQSVLCGGLTELIRAGYETLVEAGYSPEMAYFECLHEVKLIVDLIYEGGIANMRYSISTTAGHPAAIVPFVVGLGLCLNFFRDPERAPPPGEHLVLSPADGRVVAVVPEREDRFLAAPATRISIFMSPLDVHVNRNPVSGIVERVQHTAGKFRAAFADKASLDNERNALVVESRGRRYLVVQIAGAMARRIVCRLAPGDRVRRGERCGLIMFGSRVDLFVPADVRPLVQRGDRVRAGTSVVAEEPA